MEEDRLSLFLRERVELELPEQRPPHFSPSLSSETSKQRGAVLLVFSEELAQFLVFPPVLHLVVPAVVIGTVSSGGRRKCRAGDSGHAGWVSSNRHRDMSQLHSCLVSSHRV